MLIENFRPGRMEAWGLGSGRVGRDQSATRISCGSPASARPARKAQPGFGTLAEAFSGFAYITGMADGPPTLPAVRTRRRGRGSHGRRYATMIALYWRDAQGGGEGQVIDLSLYEPLFSILGPAAHGIPPPRRGPGAPRKPITGTSPRNAYETDDGIWVALSAGTQQIANRILLAIERPELADDPRFADAGRPADERRRTRRGSSVNGSRSTRGGRAGRVRKRRRRPSRPSTMPPRFSLTLTTANAAR